MSVVMIFIWVSVAMIATALWESDIEGRHPGTSIKTGWKVRLWGGHYVHSYQIWMFVLAYPLLLSLPLVIDFSWRLFGILLSAYFVGLVVEDIAWFLISPYFTLSDFRPGKAHWMPWLKIGQRFAVPTFYLIAVAAAVLSGLIFWI